MRNGRGMRAGWALAVLGLTALTGCGAPGEDGASLGNMVLFAGTTVPPARPAEIEDVYCPPITVASGSSSIQAGSGQIIIGQMARECVGQPDGSTLVKIGVEGRALMSSGGGGGRFTAPVHMVVKNGSTVLANRSRAVGVAIPAGDTQGSFSIVEDGIVVPPSAANSFEIEVGLGGRARRG
jgi:hypothetical protein